MLVFRGNFKKGKDHEENKNIVDAERLLNQIPGQKFKSRLPSVPVPNPGIENQGESDPDSAPGKRFLDADFMRVAVKKEEIHGQHGQYKTIKGNPSPKRHSLHAFASLLLLFIT